MPKAKITSKGQITLPVEVRRKLGLKSGDQVDFLEESDGRFVLYTKKYSLDEIMNLLPKPRKKATLEEIEQAIRDGWAGKVKI